MTDVSDQATFREEQERELSLAAARKNTAPTLLATGRCHHCEAHIGPERRFCDADCRDGWEINRQAQERRGLLR